MAEYPEQDPSYTDRSAAEGRGHEPQVVGSAALVLVRVHHEFHPEELITKFGWKAGAAPLKELMESPAIQSQGKLKWESAKGMLNNSINKDGYIGWFKELTNIEATDSRQSGRDAIFHSPTANLPDDRRVLFELIPLSGAVGLGWQTEGLHRDSYLAVWILQQHEADSTHESDHQPQSATHKAEASIKRLTTYWPGMESSFWALLTAVGTEQSISHDRSSGTSLADTIIQAAQAKHHPRRWSRVLTSIVAQGQRPFVAATVMRPLADDRYSLADGIIKQPGYAVRSKTVWAFDDSTVILEPEKADQSLTQGRGSGWKPKQPTDLPPADKRRVWFAKTFFVDTAAALRVLAIQAAQLEAYIDEMQFVDPGADEARQILALQRKYHVFKRRHQWNRLGRRCRANYIVSRLEQEWGIRDTFQGLDTEFRDYGDRVRNEAAENARRDRDRWSAFAEVGSLIILGTGLLATWTTMTGGWAQDEPVWAYQTAPAILLFTVTVLAFIGTIWVTVLKDRVTGNSARRPVNWGLLLASCAAFGAGPIGFVLGTHFGGWTLIWPWFVAWSISIAIGLGILAWEVRRQTGAEGGA